MKTVKRLGLVTAMVLVLTALLGVGSAAAQETTLCKKEGVGSYCGTGNSYPAHTALKATSSFVKFASNTANVECTSSSLEGETLAEAGKPLALSVSQWSMGNCSFTQIFKFPCTVSTEGGPWNASMESSALTVGNAGKELIWRIQCKAAGIDCKMGISSSLTFESGASPQLVANEEAMTTSGESGCPTGNSFSATYAVSAPTPAYARYAGPQPVTTSMCKSNAEYCKSTELYPSGTNYETKPAKLSIATGTAYGTITCTEAKLSSITTSATYGEPTLPVKGGNFLFSECKFPGSVFPINCSIIEYGAGESSVATGVGGAGVWKPGAREWNVSCPGLGGASCAVNTTESSFKVNSWEIAVSSQRMKSTGGYCGSEPRLTVTFQKSAPTEGVYFTRALL